MKSTAQIKGHPLHPILVSFPIAFFVGTLVFDILAITYNEQSFRETARYLNIGGIGSGLLAAIPGVIDYVMTVPPKSSAKSRATKHGILNTSVVVIFSIALWLRSDENDNTNLIVVLEGFGILLTTVAGWMGGTLVYRNQIGVDVRYADAGKWNESRIKPETAKIEIATTNELKINQMKLVHIGDKRIVLSRTEKGFSAFDDRCTHKGASLAGGSMICGTVQCPWHGSQFEVTTGVVKAGPATVHVQTYRIQEIDGKVFITL